MSQTPAAPEPAADVPGGTDLTDELPEQMRVRREKRERLLAAGVEAYPVGVPRTHTIAGVRANVSRLETNGCSWQSVPECGKTQRSFGTPHASACATVAPGASRPINSDTLANS